MGSVLFFRKKSGGQKIDRSSSGGAEQHRKAFFSGQVFFIMQCSVPDIG